jgi:hypothetical protein
MGYTTAAENAAITGIKSGATYISLHTGDPGTTGAAELTGGTYARVAVTWGTVASGSVTSTAAATINVPAANTITYWGLWSAATGPTFYFGGPLPASETFGASGTYSLTPTLTATN